MACTTTKEVSNNFKEEFQGSARIRQMQVLNLKREFETLNIKVTKFIKEFTHRLLKVVNQIRILGEDLLNKMVVEIILVFLLEKYEAKISSLEELRDLNRISLSKLINALQAIAQRRSIGLWELVESALLVKQKRKATALYTPKTQAAEKWEKGKTSESSSKDGSKRSMVLVIIV